MQPVMALRSSFACLLALAAVLAPATAPASAHAAAPAFLADQVALENARGAAQRAMAQRAVDGAQAVDGPLAGLRTDGAAAIPLRAPQRIRLLIAALNEIAGRPYKWGGGHRTLFDRGYDCSGAISYGLVRAGLLAYPLDSRLFMRYAAPGPGRYLTIYTSRGHAYMEVAGLRLDTSPVGDTIDGRTGVRWRPMIGRRPGFKVRHVPGL
jgi:hypothetical protein